ncbi:MAG TPA: 3-deoxy-7-phosphoheptulonate synthase [Chloroflexota bacterium]|jgi:3-deoxy-7-phosphoheptulonate synthase|nr:3-deoxy-7-phosphoheptulonate synthase [Chloroflexota bacterium]
MIVIMERRATEEQIQQVVARIEELGFRAHLSRGEERTIIGIIGDERPLSVEALEVLDGVERVVPVLHPFKLASRDFKPENTIVTVDGVRIGGDEIVVIAGPCAVESREQIFEVAAAVKEAGAKMLRGGAFKPRTSPYTFQGLGVPALELLAEVRETFGLPVVSEVMAAADIETMRAHVDMLQIGARNMQNYSLLQDVGKAAMPVLLKRGMMCTIHEWLMSAEYILSNRNYDVVLCERGIRTFETATRNTLDINAVPVAKQLTHLPVIVDPSHATGKANLVAAAAKAAIAAGADGLIIEVHPNPDRALSDGAQSLRPEAFAKLMTELRQIARAVGRRL